MSARATMAHYPSVLVEFSHMLILTNWRAAFWFISPAHPLIQTRAKSLVWKSTKTAKKHNSVKSFFVFGPDQRKQTMWRHLKWCDFGGNTDLSFPHSSFMQKNNYVTKLNGSLTDKSSFLEEIERSSALHCLLLACIQFLPPLPESANPKPPNHCAGSKIDDFVTCTQLLWLSA